MGVHCGLIRDHRLRSSVRYRKQTGIALELAEQQHEREQSLPRPASGQALGAPL